MKGLRNSNEPHIDHDERSRVASSNLVATSFKFIFPVFILLMLLLIPTVASASSLGVSGEHLTMDGNNVDNALKGVDDTTVLQYAILTFIGGHPEYAGMNQNFPWPEGRITASDNAHLWNTYFEYCRHLDLQLVRLGAGDSWGTQIQYDAWNENRTEYFQMLDTMAEQASAHGIHIVLVLAGTHKYPPCSFNGSGSPFDVNSAAYVNYINYANDTMRHLSGKDGIGIYDLWNEPDSDDCNAQYWHGDKEAFHAWSVRVAEDTAHQSDHPRTMGIAGQGRLFGWGQGDFDLATGKVPFEIAHRHYYATDKGTYLISEPQSWANNDGKPLLWGELGDNSHDPPTRWTYAENQIDASGGEAICSMTLTGTIGYPNKWNLIDRTWPAVAVPVAYEIDPIIGPNAHAFDSGLSGIMGEMGIFIFMFGGIGITAYFERYRGLSFRAAGTIVFLISLISMLVIMSRL